MPFSRPIRSSAASGSCDGGQLRRRTESAIFRAVIVVRSIIAATPADDSTRLGLDGFSVAHGDGINLIEKSVQQRRQAVDVAIS